MPLPIALGIALPLLVYTRSEALQAYISAVDLRTLTLFNVWRVPAALAFFYYGAQGELPTLFVRNAAWGDLIASASDWMRGHGTFVEAAGKGISDEEGGAGGAGEVRASVAGAVERVNKLVSVRAWRGRCAVSLHHGQEGAAKGDAVSAVSQETDNNQPALPVNNTHLQPCPENVSSVEVSFGL